MLSNHTCSMPAQSQRERPINNSQRSTDDADEAGDFDMGDFLLYLQKEGIDEAVLKFTGGSKNAMVLYTRFMASPNFEPWMKRVLDGHDSEREQY